MAKKIRLKELSELSGVSPTAISLVLNERECRISPKTQEKIRALARQYNYTPSHAARCLVTKKTNTVGFLTTDISNPFFATLASEVERRVTEHGLSLMLACGNGTVEDALNKLDFLCTRGVDGLFIAISENGSEEYNRRIKEKLNGLSVPFVAVDRWLEGLDCPRVSIDHETCGFIATDYLLKNGHRKIAMLTGPKDNYTSRRRQDGYKRAFAEYGLSLPDDSLIFEGNYDFESGYRLCDEIVASGVTAVFAGNDMMATGIMRRCGETGVAVPADLSIIGVDDIFFSKMLTVPLTTVRQDMSLIADSAFRLLVERLDKKNSPESTENESAEERATESVNIPAELIERASVARIG